MEPLLVTIAAVSGLIFGFAPTGDGDDLEFSECPAAVRKAFEAEAKGSKIETVSRDKNEEAETVYWADVTIGGKTYAVGVLEDGTLTEMNLAVGDEELPFDRCPAAVQTTFRSEAFGEKVDSVGRDLKYGVTIYQTVVSHNGKSYEIVVAEDGTLVEKALVIDDEEIKLSDCPATVRTALHEHAKGGEIGEITRYTGIGQHTFEAEVRMKGKVYLIEVVESGLLISKSLEALKN
jgi:hypothetical protein